MLERITEGKGEEGDIEKLEKLSNTNSIKELDEYTLKGLINERANIQIMQKAEKLYA